MKIVEFNYEDSLHINNMNFNSNFSWYFESGMLVPSITISYGVVIYLTMQREYTIYQNVNNNLIIQLETNIYILI